MSFDVNIVHTGSKGNCVVIDGQIVIDVGRAFTELQQYIEPAKAILITHRHGDHLNLAVINKTLEHYPWKINYLYANRNVVEKIKTHNNLASFELLTEQVIDETSTFELHLPENKHYKVKTFKLEHDVENQGFIIENELGEKLIYATDTSTMVHAPRDKYDYILVEGNYDEDKLLEDLDFDSNFNRFVKQAYKDGLLPSMPDDSEDTIKLLLTDAIEKSDEEIALLDELFKKTTSLFDRAYRNQRHLSVQAFEDFVLQNGKKSSIVYQLHESEGFGIRSDLINEI